MRRIFLPFDNDNDLVGLAAENENGWIAANPATNLATVAGKIPQNLGVRADHAIPSPVAHIQYFTSKILDTVAIHTPETDGDVNEWIGLIAVFALRTIYNFDLTFKAIPLTTSFIGGVIQEYLNDDATFSNENKPNTHIIAMCLNGEPIALFHKSILLCPFKTYRKSVLRDVEWFQDGRWIDFRGKVTELAGGSLSPVRVLLLRWIDYVLPTVGMGLASRLQLLRVYLGIEQLPPNIDLEIAPDPTINETLLSGYLPFPSHLCDRPVFEHPIPSNFFSGRVVVIQKGADDDFFAAKNNYHIEKDLIALAPLSTELAMLDNDRFLTIKSVVYDDHLQDPKGRSLTCTITLQAYGVNIVKARTYRADDIVLINQFPSVSFWPDITVDPQKWECYYLNIAQNNRMLISATNMDSFQKIKNTEIKYRVFDMENQEIIQRPVTEYRVFDHPKNPLRTWNVYFSKKPAKFVEFSYRDGDGFDHTLGQLMIARDKTSLAMPDTGAAIIGVDFGTTSTICKLKVGSTTQVVNTGGEYVLNVTPPDPDIKANFRRSFWVSEPDEIDKSGKFFTAAQLYTTDTPIGSERPYIDGKTTYLGLDILATISQANENLMKHGIYTNLKFHNPGTAAAQQTKATKVLLKNLMTVALLQGTMLGASSFSVRISYPFSTAKNIISPIWDSILTYLHTITNRSIEPKYITEAVSAGEHFKQGFGDTMAVPQNGYAVVDIGGGTTDLSFWKSTLMDPVARMKATASLKFAGGKIMIRSLFEAMQKNDTFADLWLNPDKNSSVGEIIKGFITDTQNLHANLGYSDPVYEKIQSSLDILIDKVDVNLDALDYIKNSELLFSLIRLKYFCLFYLIARFVRVKKDKGEFVPEGTFQLFMAGCGSKGLTLCDCPGFLNQLKEMFKEAAGLENITLSIIQPANDNYKQEVVSGLLKYSSQGAPQRIQQTRPSMSAGPAGTMAAAEAVAPIVIETELEDAVSIPADYQTVTAMTQEELNQGYLDLVQMLMKYSSLFHIAPVNSCDNLTTLLNWDYPSVGGLYSLLSGTCRNLLTSEKLEAINAQQGIEKECYATLMADMLIEHNILPYLDGNLSL